VGHGKAIVFIAVAATSMAEPSINTGNCKCYSNNSCGNEGSDIIRQNIAIPIIYRIIVVKSILLVKNINYSKEFNPSISKSGEYPVMLEASMPRLESQEARKWAAESPQKSSEALLFEWWRDICSRSQPS